MRKKISLILLLLVVILLLTGNISAAADVDLSGYQFIDVSTLSNDVVEKAKNTPEYLSGDYYLLFGKNDNTLYTVYFIKKVEGLKCYISSFDNYKFIVKANINTDCVYYRYNAGSELFSRSTQNAVNFWVYSTDKSNCVFYSEINIYTSTEDNDLFFLVPPHLVATAVQKVGAQEMKQVTKEILAILPVILSVLVFLLALRKGLSLLLSFLRKS